MQKIACPGFAWRATNRSIFLSLLAVVLEACDGNTSSVPSNDSALVDGTVVGRTPVAGANVAFVDAFTASAADSLQPIEDLAPTAAFRVTTDTNGEFVIELDPGRYFVYVTPPAGDSVHLAGGSLVRSSVRIEPGSTSTLTATLSETPSSDATYVGSTVCLTCHAEQTSASQTLHFLGLRKLTPVGPQLSPLQDLSKFPGADFALTYYADGNGNDNTGAGDGYGYRLATPNGYNVLLGVDATGHYQALESGDGSTISERLYIAFTYGGEGRYKQHFVTRLDKDGRYTAVAADGSYHILPGQYSETVGDPLRGFEVTQPAWVAYFPQRWAAAPVDGGLVAMAPGPEKSFDNDCAGCHFTGVSLTRNGDGLFQAHAVPDPGGPMDYDGDGAVEEMNVGCERCHGPGSEHSASGGGLIVQPDYLPPGRANLICGQCHTRGTGNATLDGLGGGGVPSRNDPVTAEVEFVRAGFSPAEFYGAADGSGILPDFGTQGGFFNPIDFATSTGSSWRDRARGYQVDLDHSKEHGQQYLDHARSAHAINAFEMLACWDCHDPHGRQRPAQVSEPADSNVLCLRCHAGKGDWAAVSSDMVDTIEAGGSPAMEVLSALDSHQSERTFNMIGVAMHLGPATYANPAGTSMLGRCTVCHMPKTAKSASWITDDEGFVIRGDISSHTFDTISPQASEAMALDGEDPVPNSCVNCHRGLFRGAYPDYRYAKQ